MNIYSELEKALKCIREKTDFVPLVGLILGSGLGDFARNVEVVSTVDYKDIEGFPVSTAPGHKGRFVFGMLRNVPVVVMEGRVHLYEGYSAQQVVMPVRLMKMMGAKVLFLTNAAGGINENFHAGDFMLINDHISSFVPNPLIGANVEELGVRFPDMSEIYSKKLRTIIKKSAEETSVEIKEGVYIQLTGASYESPAEIRMCRTLGADAVGMSTAIEAIAANHAGMLVCGISCISNLAAGISKTPLSHAEVQQCADKAAPLFKKLVEKSIENIAKEM